VLKRSRQLIGSFRRNGVMIGETVFQQRGLSGLPAPNPDYRCSEVV
jgi:hypothetical protein